MLSRQAAPGCGMLAAFLSFIRLSMFFDAYLITAVKSLVVGLLLGAVAHRLKGRSFIGWGAIGAAAAAIFPGMSLLALLALALLPSRKR